MSAETKFDKCRDYRCAWDDYDAREEGTITVQILKCIRCGNLKERAIKNRGRNAGEIIKKPSIKYTKGYLRPAGSGRETEKEKAARRARNVQK